MEINVGKAKTTKKTFISWLTTSALLLILLTLFNLGFYYIFAIGKRTLSEHFANNWFFIIFYASIFPASIAFSYRQKQINVNHDGEIDPILIKKYFEGRNYKVVSEQNGKLVMEPTKTVERLLTGAMSVSIEYTNTSVLLSLTERLVYDVHHGFKFAHIFHKQAE